MNYLTRSVTTKILAILALLIIVVLFVFSSLSYTESKRNTIELLRHENSKILDNTMSFLDFYMNEKIASFKHLQNRLSHEMSDETITRTLKFLQESQGLSLVYVGTETGKMIRSNGNSQQEATKEYDPRSRSWYKNTVKLSQAGFTDISVSNTGDELSVYFGAPYLQDGKKVGAIGGHIGMGELSKKNDRSWQH